MAAEGCVRIIKILVLVFNLLFLLLGICLLGIGAWGEATIGPYVQLSSVNLTTGPRVLMALGAAIAIVAFFGCCGAMKESKCMLTTFFTLLLVLLILEITVAVLAFHNKNKIEKELEKDISKNIVEYPHNNIKAVDDLQSELKCCGSKGPSDWINNADYKMTNDTTSVPGSCCKPEHKRHDCGRGQRVTQTNIYTTGCFPALKQKIDDNLLPTGALALTVLLIQIFGMSFAIVLICNV